MKFHFKSAVLSIALGTAACELVAGIEEKILVADSGGAGGGAAGAGAGGAGGAGGEGAAGGGSDGGGGAGGAGGKQPAVWGEPDCAEVTGTDAVTFWRDQELATVEGLRANTNTSGLAALDIPNLLVVDRDGGILESRDAGCTWSKIGDTDEPSARIVPGILGYAYGWGIAGAGALLYRYDADAVGGHGGVLQLVSPTPFIIGLQTYPTYTVRVMGADAVLFESDDAGATWEPVDTQLPTFDCFSAICQTAALSPYDQRYYFVGGVHVSRYVRPDGGISIEAGVAAGLEEVSVHAVTYAVQDPTIVWVTGQPLVGSEVRLYQSTDAGGTFTLNASTITLDPRAALLADPTASDRVWVVEGPDAAGETVTQLSLDGEELESFHLDTDVRTLAKSPAGVLYIALSDN